MSASHDNPARTITRELTVSHPEMAGTVAVVTGSARGMGAKFVEGLARQGVDVVGGDINAEAMATTAREIGDRLADSSHAAHAGRIFSQHIDVTDPDGHEALAQRAMSDLGRIDYWVNNAGVFPFALIDDVSDEQISTVLDVNVKGVLFGSQAAARHMRPGGAIVNMSSVSAVRVRRGRGAYCTSKAAVAHLTESLAVELGDKGIRVNAIAPGFIDTEMTRWVQDNPETLKSVLDNVPLHRIGTPEEVLGPLLFLLSDSARYVTGHSIAVDAGSQHV